MCKKRDKPVITDDTEVNNPPELTPEELEEAKKELEKRIKVAWFKGSFSFVRLFGNI